MVLVTMALRTQPGHVGFGAFAGRGIHPARQLVVKPADQRDLPGSELPLPLSGRGGRQYRRQRLTGQGLPRPQIGGLAEAPTGLGAADQGPFGHRMGQLAAQLLCGGLAGKLIDQGMLHGRQPWARPFTTL